MERLVGAGLSTLGNEGTTGPPAPEWYLSPPAVLMAGVYWIVYQQLQEHTGLSACKISLFQSELQHSSCRDGAKEQTPPTSQGGTNGTAGNV